MSGGERGIREDMTDFAIDMLSGTDGPIERQEARGQQALVKSDLLPPDRRGTPEEWEGLGFVFGDVVADDPLFQHATFPEGWVRRGSGHAMWSYIEDADGFERVAIFYKAAFYDRGAHAHITNPPTSEPQQSALAAIYDAQREDRFERDTPWWSSESQHAREDRAIIAVWVKRLVNPWPEPEEYFARRTVVILPDGSIESDVTEDLT